MSYMFGSYIMFHHVRGVPFDFNSGAFDNLNMWEQIDNGAQYTPTKKFLLSVPIALFLVSTHYTHYDLTYFTINLLAVLGVVIPKLPFVRYHSLTFLVGPALNLKRFSSITQPDTFIWNLLLTFRRATECVSVYSQEFRRNKLRRRSRDGITTAGLTRSADIRGVRIRQSSA